MHGKAHGPSDSPETMAMTDNVSHEKILSQDCSSADYEFLPGF